MRSRLATSAPEPGVILDEVRGEYVARLWPFLAPMLQKGIDRVATTRTLGEIRTKVESGHFRLWVVYRVEQLYPLAAAATYVRTTNKGKVAVIDTIGGHHLGEWMEPALEQFATMAKAHGCTRIEIEGRPGWTRVLKSFALARVVMEREL